MRISMDVNDVAYNPSIAPYAKIFFNGVEMQGILTADEEEGFILTYLFDEEGQITQEDGKPVTATVEGEVKIIVPTRQ